MSEPTNDTINQQIHKILGLCWHEWWGGPRWECIKCGAYLFTVSQSVPPEPNPDYCSSLDLTAKAVDKARELGGWMLTFQNWHYYGKNSYTALFRTGGIEDKQVEARDDRPAKAICLAIIAAVGGSE